MPEVYSERLTFLAEWRTQLLTFIFYNYGVGRTRARNLAFRIALRYTNHSAIAVATYKYIYILVYERDGRNY